MSNTDEQLCKMLSVRGELQLDTPWMTLHALRNSAEHGTYTLLLNEFGRTTGYLAWADINKESWRALRVKGQMPRYPFEWNEGRLLLLTDVALARGTHHTLRAALARLFPRRRAIAFVRANTLYVYSRRRGRLRLLERLTLPGSAPPAS